MQKDWKRQSEFISWTKLKLSYQSLITDKTKSHWNLTKYRGWLILTWLHRHDHHSLWRRKWLQEQALTRGKLCFCTSYQTTWTNPNNEKFIIHNNFNSYQIPEQHFLYFLWKESSRWGPSIECLLCTCHGPISFILGSPFHLGTTIFPTHVLVDDFLNRIITWHQQVQVFTARGRHAAWVRRGERITNLVIILPTKDSFMRMAITK